MDTNTKNAIELKVREFADKGFMFTAFDVTKTIRNSGTFVRHADVNTVIQDMFRSNEIGMYTRDLLDVGAAVKPFVYYHPYSDVSKYAVDWVETNPNQDGMKNDDSSSNTIGDGTSGNQASSKPNKTTLDKNTFVAKVAPTKDGRLQIPTAFVRKIVSSSAGAINGFSIKYATDFSNGTKNFVVLEPDNGGDCLVHRSRRIRLSTKKLSHIGSSDLYEIKMDKNSIMICTP